MWNSSSIWMAIHGWWVEFSFKILHGPWKTLGIGHWINLSGSTWIHLSLNRSIYFAIGTIWWPWPYKLGHVKTTKIGAEEVHPPKTDWFFPNQKVIITILIPTLATTWLPGPGAAAADAWKIGLTWLGRPETLETFFWIYNFLEFQDKILHNFTTANSSHIPSRKV